MKKLLLIASVVAMGLAANAQNPYAYNLKAEGITEGKVDANATVLNVSYALNAPAKAVAVELYDGETLVKSFPATDLTAGAHEQEISLEGLGKDKTYTWKVNVEGEAVETPTQKGALYQIYSPSGLAINNNPNSEAFGRIYLAESYVEEASLSKDKYISSAGQYNGVGVGIYQFDPQLNPIKNEDGTFGLKGGFPEAGRPNRLAFTDDGRLFLSNRKPAGGPLFELNPEDLTQNFKPVFVGEVADNGVVTNGDVTVANGANAAMAWRGSGDNLQIALLNDLTGVATSQSQYTCEVYNLGTATTWNKAPSSQVAGLTAQYSVNYAGINIFYDNDGGLWYGQFRAAPSETQPALLHVNAEGEVDYTDITSLVRAGGVALTPDGGFLLYYNAMYKLVMAKVEKDAAGEPELTTVYTIDTNPIRGCNQFAFDVANNVYLCDNGGEYFGLYQLPRTNNSYATPAMEKYSFLIPTLTGVESVNAKAVASVKYVNLQGATSATPFEGVNVVVTTYTDGSQNVVKVIK
ncbi:MAG: hypothetical protein IJ808_04330 [Muribaculaceae bacterium]|nr:hypothetical protein [Muribaculaceae bacterium]